MPFPTKIQRNQVAQAIYSLRAVTGIKQQELARLLDLSLSTLGRLEKNTEPSLRTLQQLSGLAKERGFPALAEVFDTKRAELWRKHMPDININL